jgi:WD40 repeat protein
LDASHTPHSVGLTLRHSLVHEGRVISLAWSPDGQRLATSTDDGRLLLWDTQTGQRLRSVSHSVFGLGFITKPACHLAWSPDGYQLASVSRQQGVVLFWEGDTVVPRMPIPTASISGFVRSPEATWIEPRIAWSPDGHRIAVAHFTRFSMWHVATRRLLWEQEQSGITGIAWTRDRIATSVGDEIGLWDAESGELVEAIDLGAGRPNNSFVDFLKFVGGEAGLIQSLAASRLGRYLVAAIDHRVIVWDVDAGKTCLDTTVGHPDLLGSGDQVQCVEFSGDDRLLGVAFWSTKLKFFGQSKVQVAYRLLRCGTWTVVDERHEDSVDREHNPLSFQPSGPSLATSTGDPRIIAIWDINLELREPSMAGDFDVFLSYNSQDRESVVAIARSLQDRRIRVWFDAWELRPGQRWQRALEDQIERIKSAAVFVGKNGIGPWQDMEQEAFLRQFVARSCPVIPVILRDAEGTPQIPIFLGGMTWVDFRHSTPDPMDQLEWGITGQSSNSRR